MSTIQHAVHALTPPSLCCTRLWCANSFATGKSESLSASSCSMPRSSWDSACSRRRRSPTAIGLPGRPVSVSLNRSFEVPSCPPSSSTTSVAALRRLRVAMPCCCSCCLALISVVWRRILSVEGLKIETGDWVHLSIWVEGRCECVGSTCERFEGCTARGLAVTREMEARSEGIQTKCQPPKRATENYAKINQLYILITLLLLNI